MKERSLDSTRIGHASVVPADCLVPESLRARCPLERLRLLGDDDSLHLIRPQVASERTGEKARASPCIVGGALRVAGRLLFCYAQDATYAGRSLGAGRADTIVRVHCPARQVRVLVVGSAESGGDRMREGLAALSGYARFFSENVALSGRVPQISVITRTSADGALERD